MRLLALDPGAKTGAAVFVRSDSEGWTLLGARTCSPDDVSRLPWGPVNVVVIENPEIYARSKARPRDILKLARIVGRYEERFLGSTIRLVTPHEWKGSIDGDIMTKRILASLNAVEARLCAGVDHNAIDAVGIGKWALRQPWMRALTPADPRDVG